LFNEVRSWWKRVKGFERINLILGGVPKNPAPYSKMESDSEQEIVNDKFRFKLFDHPYQ
jgi:hypothetical protein